MCTLLPKLNKASFVWHLTNFSWDLLEIWLIFAWIWLIFVWNFTYFAWNLTHFTWIWTHLTWNLTHFTWSLTHINWILTQLPEIGLTLPEIRLICHEIWNSGLHSLITKTPSVCFRLIPIPVISSLNIVFFMRIAKTLPIFLTIYILHSQLWYRETTEENRIKKSKFKFSAKR